jgi:hypothetical protein
MKNNKGLSTIVTTLIIILLVLVAIGIIWGVVKGLLDDSEKDISGSSVCLNIQITPGKLGNQTAGDTTNITFRRVPTGINQAVGAKVIVFSSSSNTELITLNNTYMPGEVRTEVINTSEISNNSITRVEAIPFYYDESGVEVLCSTPTSTNY